MSEKGTLTDEISTHATTLAGLAYLEHPEEVLGARLELGGRHAHVRRVRVGGAEALRAEHQVHRRLELSLRDEDLQTRNNFHWGSRAMA